MSLSLWVGPRWVGPRLASAGATGFGSGGFDRYEGDMPDELLSRALQAVRDDLILPPRGRRELEESPSRAQGQSVSADSLIKVQQVTGSASTIESQRLWRYDSALRQLLIVDALTARLKLELGDKQAVCRLVDTNEPIIELDAPTETMWNAEVGSVSKAAKRRKGQSDEISSQVEATPTFFASILGITTTTHPNTVEMMSVVSHVVGRIVHPIKHAFAIPRPAEVVRTIGPAIGTPPHYSFPAGHAAFCYAQAMLFTCVFKGAPVADLFRLAALVSDNRVVAGLHYPMDTDGGFVIGNSIGLWLAQVHHGQDGKHRASLRLSYKISGNRSVIDPGATAEGMLRPCPEWAALVEKAKAEWGQ